MFTGLIQEVGQIQSIQTSGDAARLRIGCTMAPDLAIGESVAVNGACLTVEQKGADNFLAYASAETLTKTALDGLGSGKPVNLERALQLGDRLGGHLVAGHVDATGRFDSLREADEGYWLKIHAPDEILKLSVPKGSITVDGISLTIVDLTAEYFTVAVIPQTWNETNLRHLKPGDRVNLESDMIGKYVARLLHAQKQTPSSFPAGSIWELMGR